MSSPFAPSDEAERARIRESLNETLFVEAGAGTGKTTRPGGQGGPACVDRQDDPWTGSRPSPLPRPRRPSSATASGTCSRRRRALGAATKRGAAVSRVSTTSIRHPSRPFMGFARSLLAERPLEAGLPPSFEVMDPIASDLEFEEVWRDWIDAALDGLKPLPTLPMALSLGLRPGDLREIALGFHSDYDLVATASFDEEPMPRSETIRELIATSPESSACANTPRLGSPTSCSTTPSGSWLRPDGWPRWFPRPPRLMGCSQGSCPSGNEAAGKATG